MKTYVLLVSAFLGILAREKREAHHLPPVQSPFSIPYGYHGYEGSLADESADIHVIHHPEHSPGNHIQHGHGGKHIIVHHNRPLHPLRSFETYDGGFIGPLHFPSHRKHGHSIPSFHGDYGGSILGEPFDHDHPVQVHRTHHGDHMGSIYGQPSDYDHVEHVHGVENHHGYENGLIHSHPHDHEHIEHVHIGDEHQLHHGNLIYDHPYNHDHVHHTDHGLRGHGASYEHPVDHNHHHRLGLANKNLLKDSSSSYHSSNNIAVAVHPKGGRSFVYSRRLGKREASAKSKANEISKPMPKQIHLDKDVVSNTITVHQGSFNTQNMNTLNNAVGLSQSADLGIVANQPISNTFDVQNPRTDAFNLNLNHNNLHVTNQGMSLGANILDVINSGNQVIVTQDGMHLPDNTHMQDFSSNGSIVPSLISHNNGDILQVITGDQQPTHGTVTSDHQIGVLMHGQNHNNVIIGDSSGISSLPNNVQQGITIGEGSQIILGMGQDVTNSFAGHPIGITQTPFTVHGHMQMPVVLGDVNNNANGLSVVPDPSMVIKQREAFVSNVGEHPSLNTGISQIIHHGSVPGMGSVPNSGNGYVHSPITSHALMGDPGTGSTTGHIQDTAIGHGVGQIIGQEIIPSVLIHGSHVSGNVHAAGHGLPLPRGPVSISNGVFGTATSAIYPNTYEIEPTYVHGVSHTIGPTFAKTLVPIKAHRAIPTVGTPVSHGPSLEIIHRNIHTTYGPVFKGRSPVLLRGVHYGVSPISSFHSPPLADPRRKKLGPVLGPSVIHPNPDGKGVHIHTEEHIQDHSLHVFEDRYRKRYGIRHHGHIHGYGQDLGKYRRKLIHKPSSKFYSENLHLPYKSVTKKYYAYGGVPLKYR